MLWTFPLVSSLAIGKWTYCLALASVGAVGVLTMGSTVGLSSSVLAGHCGLVGRLSAYRKAVLYAMELCA